MGSVGLAIGRESSSRPMGWPSTHRSDRRGRKRERIGLLRLLQTLFSACPVVKLWVKGRILPLYFPSVERLPKSLCNKSCWSCAKKSFFPKFSLSLLWPRAGGYFIQTEAAASFGLHKIFFLLLLSVVVLLLLPPLVRLSLLVFSIFLPFVIGCKRVGICCERDTQGTIAKAV